MLSKLSERHFIIIFCCFGLLLYSIHIFNQTPVDIDYDVVVEPLKNVHSFSDYINFSNKHILFDLQPIRDFSLKTDLIVGSWFGIKLHGFFNALIWILSGLVLLKILRELEIEKKLAYLVCTIFLAHPIAAWVIGWPSARKHLLALLFIGLATFFSIKLKKNKQQSEFWIFLSYLLSVLSQPISLLWIIPFFIFFFEEIKSTRLLSLFYLLSATFLVVALGNYVYFNYAYQFATGAPKIIDQEGTGLAFSIAAISRSMSQIFLPTHFAYEYVKSSFFTLTGLPIFTLIFLAGAQITKKNSLILFLILLILFPLILMYYRPTNIFVSDTYLVIPLFFSIIAIAIFIQATKSTKAWPITLSILVILLCIKNVYEQTLSSDEYRYLKISYEREPTCRNLLPYAMSELNQFHLESFKNISTKGITDNCILIGGHSGLMTSRIYFYNLLLEQNISMKTKYESSFKMPQLTPDIVMIQSILYHLLNDKPYLKPEDRIISNIQSRERQLISLVMKKTCEADDRCNKKKLIDFFKN